MLYLRSATAGLYEEKNLGALRAVANAGKGAENAEKHSQR